MSAKHTLRHTFPTPSGSIHSAHELHWETLGAAAQHGEFVFHQELLCHSSRYPACLGPSSGWTACSLLLTLQGPYSNIIRAERLTVPERGGDAPDSQLSTCRCLTKYINIDCTKCSEHSLENSNRHANVSYYCCTVSIITHISDTLISQCDIQEASARAEDWLKPWHTVELIWFWINTLPFISFVFLASASLSAKWVC